MNLALYREFRPKTFEEVVGQGHITRTLANQVKNNNTTHAYLFTGARGTGKTSCAKIFSKAINCLNNHNGSPCGECANCKALSDINTDILEIDAASNNRVDEIRDLRERVKYPPIVGKKKVYIIDEVHMLTESAFNALLKTLEEPPEYVVFILATTEVHKLPATILSRCTRFDFRLLSVEELVGQLKKIFDIRKVKYDEESLYVIARQGEGSSRDTLSIADSVMAYCENNITIDKTLDVLGLSSTKVISDIVLSIGEKDVAGLFKNIQKALTTGKSIQILCKELTEYFKNLILVANGVNDSNILQIMSSDLETYKSISKMFTNEQMKIAFEKLSRIELDLKFSLNPQNLIESVCVSLINMPSNVLETKVVKETTVKPIAGIKVEQPKAEVKVEQQPIVQKVAEEKSVSTESENTTKTWGEVLVKIKDKNMFAFSAALKNIYGVEGSGNILKIHTNDQSVFQIVDAEDKKGILLNVLKELNSNYNSIIVVYDENNKSKADIVKELKAVFLDKIKIKE